MTTPSTADSRWLRIVDAVARRYRTGGAPASRFARSKMRRDRVFRQLLEHGWVTSGQTIADLGCGQGLLAACLAAASEADREQRWPPGWAPAPHGTFVLGFDLGERQVLQAQAAGLPNARFTVADMRDVDLPPCDIAACIDTLHYLPLADQDRMLLRARRALRPGGLLLLRVHDSTAPWRWRLGLMIDRLTRGFQGGGFGPVHGRTVQAWTSALSQAGFTVETFPMNGRPPFANRLLVARPVGAPIP